MVSVGHTNEMAPYVGWHLQYLNGSQLLRHLQPNSAAKRHPGRPFPWLYGRVFGPCFEKPWTSAMHAISNKPTATGKYIYMCTDVLIY